MYKIKDFDYDLWKSADGKCFAKVRSTGEVCEVSNETMKLLRCEEKRIYRELELKKSLDSECEDDKTKASIMYPLSFEINDDENDEASCWLQSDESFEEAFYSGDKTSSSVSDNISAETIELAKAIGQSPELVNLQKGLLQNKL